jgi:perosamine synthetase
MADQITLPTRAAQLSCGTADSLFLAIERALSGEIGVCYVIDGLDKLVGEITLDHARSLIRDGSYTLGLSAGEAARQTDVVLRPGQTLSHAGVTAAPVIDGDGRLIDVAVNPSATFVPVAEPYLSQAEFRNLVDAFLSTWISSQGQYIRDFETNFAKQMGARYGLAVANGTVSLHLAMVALGIGPGDEVIVPDLTFAASINTIIHTGATPVIIDVDPDTWVISPETFEKAITPRTRGVMPVHVFGRPCPMTEIMDIAHRRGVYVIEDAAESHGATYDGRPVGSFGHTASYSFFGNKNITTGEGGMVLTSEAELYEHMRVLRDHGMRPERRYWHEEVGYNYRMTNMQAAIGCAQLERLPDLLGRRAEAARTYKRHMEGIPGLVFAPDMPPRFGPVTWFVCAQVPADKRAALIDACKHNNIDLRPFFNGLSVMPAYRRFGRPCPVSDHLSKTGVNLPTSARVSDTLAKTMADIFYKVLSA